MYDTILVPTDGSDGAKAAARHALALANAFDGEVRFLSIVDDRTSASLAGYDSPDDDRRDALEASATEHLESLEELATDAAVPFESTVEHGIPHEAILDHADDHGADLVAMGTHGRTGLQRMFMGSVTERVVRTSDVPVFTTRTSPDESAGYDDVLIPTDGSDAATAAVEHGLAVAERYDGTVHALSAVDLSSIGGSYDAASIIKAWKRNCEQAVDEVADAAEERGIDVVTEVDQSTPYRAIESYVDERGIDLVTMGTHGRTGLERYLVGSVTARTVRTSEVPVLTTR